MNQPDLTYRNTRTLLSKFEYMVVSSAPKIERSWVRFITWLAIVDMVIVSGVVFKIFYLDNAEAATNSSTGLYMLSSTRGAVTSIAKPEISLATLIDHPATSEFVNRIKNSGLMPISVKDIKRPIYSVDGKMIILENDNIQIYEYTDNATALEMLSSLKEKYAASSRGQLWKDDMHIYVDGPLVVYYMGRKAAILSALQPLPVPSTLSTTLKTDNR